MRTSIASLYVTCRGPWRCLCSPRNSRGVWNPRHTREECGTSYLPRRLGVDMFSSLMTFALPVRPHQTLPPVPWEPVSISLSIKTIWWKVSHVLFKELWCITSDLYSAWLCSSKRFMNILLDTWDWVHCHQNCFHQIVVCVNIPKLKHLGSEPVTVYWAPLNQAAFLSPSDHLCWLWRLQKIL